MVFVCSDLTTSASSTVSLTCEQSRRSLSGPVVMEKPWCFLPCPASTLWARLEPASAISSNAIEAFLINQLLPANLCLRLTSIDAMREKVLTRPELKARPVGDGEARRLALSCDRAAMRGAAFCSAPGSDK